MIEGAYKNPNMLPYSMNLFFSSQLTVNYLSIFLSICLCLSVHLSMYLSLQLDLNTNWIVCYLRKGRHAMEMEKKSPNSTTQKSFPALCTLMFQQPHRQAGNWYVCSKADFEDQNSSKLHRDLKDHKVLRELLFLIKSSTTPSLHAP